VDERVKFPEVSRRRLSGNRTGSEDEVQLVLVTTSKSTMLPILTDSILPTSRRTVVCPSGSFSILNIGRMLLSGSDEAVGIDSGDNPDAGAAEVM